MRGAEMAYKQPLPSGETFEGKGEGEKDISVDWLGSGEGEAEIRTPQLPWGGERDCQSLVVGPGRCIWVAGLLM